MSNLSSRSVFSFVVLGFCLTFFVGQSSAAPPPLKYALPGSRWTVTIYNSQSSANLIAHCKSKDDDLGEHRLSIGQQYNWSFREAFGQATMFWCNFQSPQHGASNFEVFWPEKGTWLAQRCNYDNCIWSVRDDGFYLKNIPAGTFEFVHGWGFGS